MNYYRAVVRYDGTDFCGWQKQPDQRTIQGEIEKVIEKITQSSDFQIIGSGRTDSGVHANAQVVRIKIAKDLDSKVLYRALNSLLPKQIFVIKLEDSSEDFQPVFDAKNKTYKYYFSLTDDLIPFFRNYITYLPGENFCLDLAHNACELFVGEHDFSNYQTVGTPVKSTVREIFHCSISSSESENDLWPKNTYILTINGNGFLKQMVRLIMAAIWGHARGRVSLAEIENSLKNPVVKKLAPTAPPQGLYLQEVFY